MNPTPLTPGNRKLLRLLRAHEELKLRELKVKGVPPPPSVAGIPQLAPDRNEIIPLKQRPCPGPWVSGDWVKRAVAASPDWFDQDFQLERDLAPPFSSWIVFRRMVKASAASQDSVGEWHLRLEFRAPTNQPSDSADVKHYIDLYDNAFFEVVITLPRGQQQPVHVRVTTDSKGQLLSDWRPLGGKNQPTDFQYQSRFADDPVSSAKATGCVPPVLPESVDPLDPYLIELGGEG